MCSLPHWELKCYFGGKSRNELTAAGFPKTHTPDTTEQLSFVSLKSKSCDSPRPRARRGSRRGEEWRN